MTPAEMAALNAFSHPADCSSHPHTPLSHNSPSPSQSTPIPASALGSLTTPPLVVPSRPSTDADPVSPVVNSPVEADPPPGSKQVITDQLVSLTVRIMLDTQACWTHCNQRQSA